MTICRIYTFKYRFATWRIYTNNLFPNDIYNYASGLLFNIDGIN
jgi:hypothetical protein